LMKTDHHRIAKGEIDLTNAAAVIEAFRDAPKGPFEGQQHSAYDIVISEESLPKESDTKSFMPSTPMGCDITPSAPHESDLQAANTETLPEPAAHLKFPVVVGDGRQLTIEWDHGADPQQVALTFAQAHGIHSDELPTIVAFVEHAESLTRTESQGSLQEASASPSNSKEKDELGLEDQVSKMGLQDEDENVKTLVDMGLGDAECMREILRANDNNVQKVVECLMK